MSGAVNIKPLSVREEKKLKELESVIDAHRRGFYEVGMALAKIQAEKLYRLQADTFEIYGNEVWGLIERQLYRLVNAALVFENLTNWSGNDSPENLRNCAGFKQEDLPTNEAQCRPLTSITTKEQTIIWNQTIQTSRSENTKITAALVARCVREYKGEEFRKKLDEAKEKLTPKAVKEHGQNISPKMDQSYRGMLKTIEHEMQSNWRHTSKDMVRDCLQNLLAAIDEL
ncbi:hypothetical protein JYT85_01490 [Desulfocapsa sp. AH-315-G09]|uniref:Uncharacterized protein n=1 Tax=Desulfotalea psychrophila TaxID=84980 RepID=A0ABS3AV76_9BACT|nr:hypothetical protein [Desulfocapsa sp.]MBN4045992.1 hypothetical protein [bacterium AH-315-P11]MBN4065300.1 hypothetical protein [Desulfocapsa sp. AH-315-G09]MBN4068430.1 hypothetical protein [Desulfotalea psychrophila]